MGSKVHFGTMVIDRLGSWPHPYFLPQASPIQLTPKESTWEKMLLAQGALGELRSMTRVINPSELSLKVGLLQEALASSRIEGTQATLSEVIEAEFSEEITSSAVLEVLSYQAALNYAVSQLGTTPISRRLICAAHERLMSNPRGVSKRPGKFRETAVWIGSYDSTPENARFIPPLPHHLDDLFADWERFVNDTNSMPLVARLAWAHYQFETIHPFLDGNGRIGRIIIELMLVESGALGGPYLGISRYIERFKQEYLDVLARVRTEGDVDGLIRYFAAAIENQALETVNKLEQLVKLRQEWTDKFGATSKFMPKLIRCLAEQPILTVAYVTANMGVSQPTASKLLRQAEQFGMVVSRGQLGRGRRETWISEAFWAIFSPHESP